MTSRNNRKEGGLRANCPVRSPANLYLKKRRSISENEFQSELDDSGIARALDFPECRGVVGRRHGEIRIRVVGQVERLPANLDRLSF